MEWDLEGYAIGSRPSLPEFGELLEDVTFVDYFNIFLSLPVFGQSLFYRRSVKKFELHPSINKAIYVLDRQKLHSWVIRERFSLFITSHLYVEYLLNKRLKQTTVHLTPSDRDGSVKDRRLKSLGDMLRRALKKARGMRRFRRSLSGTTGRGFLAFWLDAELFRREPSANERRVLLRDIIRKYFCSGAVWEMPPAIKAQVLQDGIDVKLTLQAEFSEGCPSRNLLSGVQQTVLNTLQTYWLPRYMGWCRARYMAVMLRPGQYFIEDDDDFDEDEFPTVQTANISNNTIAGLVQLTLTPSPDARKERESASSTKLSGRESDSAVGKDDETPGSSSPEKQESTPKPDSGKEKQKTRVRKKVSPSVRIVEPDGTVTQARSDAEPKKSGNKARRKSKTQDPIDEEKAKEEAQERRRQVKQALHLLKTKYPMRLTTTTLNMLEKQEKEGQKCRKPDRSRERRGGYIGLPVPQGGPRKGRRKQRERQELPPVVDLQTPAEMKKKKGGQHIHKTGKTGASHTPSKLPSQIAPSITKEPHKKIEPIDQGDSSPLHLPHIAGTSSLPQPTSYSLYSLYKEQQEVFLRTHKPLILALESDKLAGKPFCSYLAAEGLEREKDMFKFWQAAQELLSLEMTFSSGDKSVWYEKSRRLVDTHLRPGLPEYVSVGRALATVLSTTPPSALWCVYLQEVQISLTTLLAQSWKEYCDQEIDKFQQAVSIRQRRVGVGTSDYLPLIRMSSFGMLGLPARKSSTEIFAKKQTAHPLPGETGTSEANKKPAGLQRRKGKALDLAGHVIRNLEEMSELSDYFEESDDELSLQGEKTSPGRGLLPKKIDYKQLAAQSVREYPNKRYKGPVTKTEVQCHGNSKLPFFFRSVKKHGVVLPPPSKPKNFGEVLRNSVHLEYFKRYLLSEGSETPLLFWMAVESMRIHSKDNRDKQSKATQIVKRYFSKQAGKGVALQCEAQVIKDIAKMGSITPAMLLSAQAAVGKTLGDRWYERYRDCFPDDSITDLQDMGYEEDDMHAEKAKPKVISLKAKTRAICIAIIRSIIALRHALNRQLSSQEFEDYLKAESFRPSSANIQTPKEPKIKDFEAHDFLDSEDVREKKPRLTRRFVGGRVIFVEKLTKDLAFFKEVECYKALADEVAKNAQSGEYSMDEDELLKKKASAIIKCFLESSVPPKVQINIPPEMASHIVADANRGFYDRGLFYDAVMTIFPTLVHFWKKYCREKNDLSPHEDWKLSLRRKSFHFPDYLHISTDKPLVKVAGLSFADPPRLLFSMAQGPRLITPPQLPDTSDQMADDLLNYLSTRGDVVRGVSPTAVH